MSVREANFDGLIGPMHNYAGLSLGNVASAINAGSVSHPRAAALQGLRKMAMLMQLGVLQGFLPPAPRPAVHTLRRFGFDGEDHEVLSRAAREDPELFGWAFSASSMWTANAATVIAEADSADRRLHLVTANLASMPHRSLEAEDTFAILRRVFPDSARFAVHPPLPYGRHFGDEGAANHMRLAASHDAVGVNVFVHGAPRPGPFPERQALAASRAVARIAGVRVPVFALQSAKAIVAGAFHNDVVAVANENLLLAHAEAYEDRDALYDAIRARLPSLRVVEISSLPLGSAVSSYLFNSQLVTLPNGATALVLPVEAQEDPAVWAEVERHIAPAVSMTLVVDVRESMRNGGGPACLRLRVPLSDAALAAVDSRFLLTEARLEAMVRLIETCWPEAIAPSDISDPELWRQAEAAHAALDVMIEAGA